MAQVSRRRFLGTAGAAAVGGLVTGAAGARATEAGPEAAPAAGDHVVAFRGPRQAGIVTPAQERLHLAAFDLVPGTRRADVAALLADWTEAADRMSRGLAVGEELSALSPPDDTGEAEGLSAAHLTVTFGVGPGLFERRELGLTDRRPAALQPLRALPGDQLIASRSGGDLCVHACADDPQVAFHAVRNLARLGRGLVVLRWTQLGFGRTSRTTRDQGTPRNLMGFRDGTNNITAEETAALDQHVWIGDEAPAWLRGGTYLVARRIRMLIEVWDRAALADQEATIGRHKRSGAPLGTGHERDPVDLQARSAGAPVIPPHAHIRLAAPTTNGGIRLLRRGYSFTDGVDPELGQLDAGLMFVAFTRDPGHVATVQERLGSSDALNEYIRHDGSAVFAVPPGVRPGRSIGDALFS